MTPDPWYGLELRHLVALRAIAREGSFRRAGARLGYTQSAISQQIAALERVVGEPLVERPGGPRPTSLTPAGRLLLRHFEAIDDQLVAARADLVALRTTTLRVGTYQSPGARILPAAMLRFGRACPDVEVVLTESVTDEELLDMVERGHLDLTFAVLPLGEGPFEWVELLRDRYVLLVPASSPLATLPRPPTTAEMSGLDLIGFRKCRSVCEAERQLRSIGVRAEIVFRSNDNGTLQGLVGAGMGAALVPQLALNPLDDRVAALEVDARLPPRILALAWHRDRSRSTAERTFTDAVVSASKAIEAAGMH